MMTTTKANQFMWILHSESQQMGFGKKELETLDVQHLTINMQQQPENIFIWGTTILLSRVASARHLADSRDWDIV